MMEDQDLQVGPGDGARVHHQQQRVRLVNAAGSLYARHVKYVDIFLRLPFLFLMDALLLNDMSTGIFDRLHFIDSNIQGASDKQRGSTTTALTDFILSQGRFSYNAKEDFFYSLPEHYLPIARQNVCASNTFTQEDLNSIFTDMYGNPDWKAVPVFLDVMMAVTVYALALAILINSTTSHLISLYGYLASTVLVCLSYLVNTQIIDQVIQADVVSATANSTGAQNETIGWLSGPGPLILANYACQSMIGFTSSKMLKVHWNNNVPWLVYNVIMHSALVPSALAVYGGLEPHWLRLSVILCAVPPAAIVSVTLSQSFGQLVRSFCTGAMAKFSSIREIGFNTFIELEWSRLYVPSLLRTFWIVRLAQQLTMTLIQLALSAGFDSDWNYMPMSMPSVGQVLNKTASLSKEMITRGNETMVAVLGMTSVVAKVCHYVGSFFHHYLTYSDVEAAAVASDEERSVASVCAIVFFVLALQTGLTSLNPDKRLIRLYQNLCLLITAIFHFIHNMVSSHLIGLGASGSSAINYRKHFRALTVCLFLTIAPLGLLVCLWKWFSMGTFLLAVTVFCVEVVIKVVVTVSVYGLLLYDARVRKGTWEELDDAVYFVKAAGNTVEFLCAVLLFLNGGWILFFESGGLIRAIMMLIHAYCNIWCEARNGWRNFVKRRSAVAKINLLPDATQEQLAAYADVCSICYQDMEYAKRTRCGHMFHAICLRKWLYIQDTCPLCHAGLVQDKQNKSTTTEDDPFDVNEVIDNDRVIEEGDIDESEDDDSEDLAIDTETEVEEPSNSSIIVGDGEEEEGGKASVDLRDDSDLVYDSMEEYRREACGQARSQSPQSAAQHQSANSTPANPVGGVRRRPKRRVRGSARQRNESYTSSDTEDDSGPPIGTANN